MESILGLKDEPLHWVQPKRDKQFELRTADALYGTLHFESIWGTRARAETADGSWTFKRVGFLNPRITVRQVGSDQDLAVYVPKFWGDGYVELVERNYHWKALGFWAAQWGFAGPDEKFLFLMNHGKDEFKLSDLLKIQAHVEIAPEARGMADLPLLMLLGWYLLILHQEDATGAAAAASAAA